MPKISEMMKKGKFLKKDDLDELGGEVTFTIVGVKEMNVAMENQPESLKWVMKLREIEQLFVLNNSNLMLMEKALGSDDTTEWRGKSLTLYVDDSIMFGGKPVGGIRVRTRPVQAARPAAAPPDTADEFADAATTATKPAGAKPASGKGKSFDDFEDDLPF